MTGEHDRRTAVLAEHQPVHATDGYVMCCECGYGADRLTYGDDIHIKHQNAAVAIAELNEFARRLKATFAAMSDTLRSITTTVQDTTEQTEQRSLPKPATTPPMWANNPTQQKRRR
ncbi:hypothetical protein SEA_RUTHY_60 [Gordonia phage Ruthy]|uniref:Uncharacterized protein n=1 Tax=Gordonia phage Ruthy TaxID=2250323 RepID=A0A345L5H1_9CAUD|nr:hypothetical protein HOT73_gp60 [Gordonia phage Ruthy]AXH50523.1 hypothetical protein SEA_RUTHY_60 [Gordonia phage Ruthy]